MKLELIHTIETDGEWYKVTRGDHSRYFGVKSDGSNKEEKLKEATEYYNVLKENKQETGKKEIILSEEI